MRCEEDVEDLVFEDFGIARLLDQRIEKASMVLSILAHRSRLGQRPLNHSIDNAVDCLRASSGAKQDTCDRRTYVHRCRVLVLC